MLEVCAFAVSNHCCVLVDAEKDSAVSDRLVQCAR